LMEKEFLHGLMEEYTQENSQLDIWMDQENYMIHKIKKIIM
jgi:hypothetical protein